KKDIPMQLLANMLGKLGGGQHKLSELLLDPKRPVEVRAKMLFDILQNNEPILQQAVLAELLQQLPAKKPEDEILKLMECYEQALAELEQGPVRPATFIAAAEGDLPGPTARAHVITPDGHERYPTLHPKVSLADLKPGMTIYLDPKGTVVLGAARSLPRVG